MECKTHRCSLLLLQSIDSASHCGFVHTISFYKTNDFYLCYFFSEASYFGFIVRCVSLHVFLRLIFQREKKSFCTHKRDEPKINDLQEWFEHTHVSNVLNKYLNVKNFQLMQWFFLLSQCMEQIIITFLNQQTYCKLLQNAAKTFT